ncbi:ClC-ec1 [Suttonella ornithocola]|uniref:ClC-ec1 n=1 Tax=Suttonella ornithocola TaxID=279832 RepID=A0A380MY52_9GAMM|nr:ClC-ec1 [Suttonella ornithocola]
MRWERGILIGVVASGLFLISIEGNSPYFPLIYHRSNFSYPLLWISICAIVCGIAGGLFGRALSIGAGAFIPKKWRQLPANYPLITAGICGLILAALGTYYHGQTYGTGYYTVAESLRGDPSLHFGSLSIGKWLSTIASYWAGIPGGIFTPCLTIGAIIGQSIAELTHFSIPSDILVLLCTAAFLAAATQSPLTASVVVMEMTATQNLLFWMLVCTITASVISRQFCPKPFYHFSATKFIKRIQEKQKAEYEQLANDMHKKLNQK